MSILRMSTNVEQLIGSIVAAVLVFMMPACKTAVIGLFRSTLEITGTLFGIPGTYLEETDTSGT